MKFVRVRPYDKRRGQLVRRYVYGGKKFEADRGWYDVEDAIAEYLEKVLTFPENPDSKPVFDVSDRDGAQEIERAQYEAENPERKISEAVAGAQMVKVEDLDETAKAALPAAKPAPAPAKEEVPAKETASEPAPEPDTEGEGKEPTASTTPAKTKTAASGKSRRKGRFGD